MRFVERLIADHRGILQVPSNLTALREICDTFIDAGWTSSASRSWNPHITRRRPGLWRDLEISSDSEPQE
ncbi:hypothetical protein ACWDX6_02020 [Streptomyces sp. NPDC003027]